MLLHKSFLVSIKICSVIILYYCKESHTPTKDDLVARAKLAEQAERYDDMVEIMKKLAEMDDVLVAEVSSLVT